MIMSQVHILEQLDVWGKVLQGLKIYLTIHSWFPRPGIEPPKAKVMSS